MMGGTDRENIEQYSSISWLAVLAFLTGLLSFLALAHPVLWCLPFIGATLAVFSIQRIRRSDGALSGQGIAAVALGLSCCAASMTFSRALVAREVQHRQAIEFADRWLAALHEGRVRLAHQWTLSKLYRGGSSQSLKEVYENEEQREALQRFMREEPSRSLIELAPDARFEYQGTRSVTGDRRRRFFSLDYTFQTAGEDSERQPLNLIVLRRHDAEFQLDWWQISQIGSLGNDDGPRTPAAAVMR